MTTYAYNEHGEHTPPFMLVTAAGYEPFGPLSSLSLSNGLTEARAFDGRYAPEEIRPRLKAS